MMIHTAYYLLNIKETIVYYSVFFVLFFAGAFLGAASFFAFAEAGANLANLACNLSFSF
jgi:hypothetical protein